jgi:hypothetical protein
LSTIKSITEEKQIQLAQLTVYNWSQIANNLKALWIDEGKYSFLSYGFIPTDILGDDLRPISIHEISLEETAYLVQVIESNSKKEREDYLNGTPKTVEGNIVYSEPSYPILFREGWIYYRKEYFDAQVSQFQQNNYLRRLIEGVNSTSE